MTNMVRLNRRELTRILELFTLFNESGDYGYVELTQESSSGIGTILNAKFNVTHKDVDGEFIVEITGQENW